MQGLAAAQGLQGLQAANCTAPTLLCAAATGKTVALDSATAALRAIAAFFKVFRVVFDIN